MKGIALLLVFLAPAVFVFCQSYTAERISTSGVVVQKYTLYDRFNYDLTERVIIVGDSIYPFIRYRYANLKSDVISALIDIGEDPADYSPIFMDTSLISDLSLCPYDSLFFNKDLGAFTVLSRDGFWIEHSSTKILSSKVFTEIIYSVYAFDGEIIIYRNHDEPVIELPEIDEYCECAEIPPYGSKSFTILKRTDKVSPYVPRGSDVIHFQPAGTNLIPIGICE